MSNEKDQLRGGAEVFSHFDIDLIRKTASAEEGRRSFHELYRNERQLSIVEKVELQKVAAADEDLLRIAAQVAPEGSLLETYENLGGGYKHATIADEKTQEKELNDGR